MHWKCTGLWAPANGHGPPEAPTSCVCWDGHGQCPGPGTWAVGLGGCPGGVQNQLLLSEAPMWRWVAALYLPLSSNLHHRGCALGSAGCPGAELQSSKQMALHLVLQIIVEGVHGSLLGALASDLNF